MSEKDESGENGATFTGDVKTGGGDANVQRDAAQGDKVGGDKNIQGDVVQGYEAGGDKVGGDKISVGDISGSSSVAIGRSAQASVQQDDAIRKVRSTLNIANRNINALAIADDSQKAELNKLVAELLRTLLDALDKAPDQANLANDVAEVTRHMVELAGAETPDTVLLLDKAEMLKKAAKNITADTHIDVDVRAAEVADYLIDLSENVSVSPGISGPASTATGNDPVVGLAVVNAGDQDLLVTARQHLGVSVTDLGAPNPVSVTFKGLGTDSQVTSLAVAARETSWLVVSGWSDGRVLLSDLFTGEQVRILEAPTSFEAITSVMIAELDDGLNVLCGRMDGRMFRWDVGSGHLHGEAFGTGPAINVLAGGPSDDRFLAVMGLSDGRLLRWDVASGKVLGEALEGHENGVSAITVTDADGRPRIVSGGGDQVVRVWDLESGEPVGEAIRGHLGSITALAVSELDGRPVIVSGGSDGTLRIWDLITKAAVGEAIEAHEAKVSALAAGLVEGQSVVFSGGVEPEVRSWRLAEIVRRKHSRSKVEWKNDSPSQIDLLRHEDLAHVLGTRLRRIHNENPRNSFLIHVDGRWGSGKSTLLGFLGKQLDPYWIDAAREEEGHAQGEEATESRENDPASGTFGQAPGGDREEAEWMVLWFDAWRQSGIGPPWWTLLASLREQIDSRLGWWSRLDLRLRETLFKVRLAGSSYLLAVIIMLLLLVAGLMVVDFQQVNVEWLTDTAKGVTAVFGALVILWTGARVASKFLLWDSARGAVIFEQSTRDPMRIAAEHFAWLLGKVGKPVVFFVDDLDRCDEGYVVALLEAIQTLIRDVKLKQTRGRAGRGKRSPGRDSQQLNVGPHFVVAADGAWIRKSFAKNFESFAGAVDEPGRPLGYLFIDKLFQLTVPMPYLSDELQQHYFDGLLGVAGGGVGDELEGRGVDVENQVEAAREQVQASGSDAEVMKVFGAASVQVQRQIAGTVVRRLTAQEVETTREHDLQKFAALLDPNPRSMKRFLNAYSVMLSIQPLQLNAVSVDTLALWTILRLRWPALADHLVKSPEAVSYVAVVGPVPGNVPEALRELFNDPELNRLVNFEEGGPLTPEKIESVR